MQPVPSQISDMSYRIHPPAHLYRVNYGPDPLYMRDWSAARYEDRLGNRIFGHRWDDPQRKFRCLYSSESLLGAMIEFLQDLVPSPWVSTKLKGLEFSGTEAFPRVGALPTDLFDNFYCSTFTVEPGTPFVDVSHTDIISGMREEHGALARILKLPPIERSTVSSRDFELTRAIARSMYREGFAGIKAGSHFGMPHENWTLFEEGHLSGSFRVGVVVEDIKQLKPEHPDLIDALNALGLRLEGDSMFLHYDQPPRR